MSGLSRDGPSAAAGPSGSSADERVNLFLSLVGRHIHHSVLAKTTTLQQLIGYLEATVEDAVLFSARANGDLPISDRDRDPGRIVQEELRGYEVLQEYSSDPNCCAEYDNGTCVSMIEEYEETPILTRGRGGVFDHTCKTCQRPIHAFCGKSDATDPDKSDCSKCLAKPKVSEYAECCCCCMPPLTVNSPRFRHPVLWSSSRRNMRLVSTPSPAPFC
jgi:hypothetical protein